jgi:hypothetical protein
MTATSAIVGRVADSQAILPRHAIAIVSRFAVFCDTHGFNSLFELFVDATKANLKESYGTTRPRGERDRAVHTRSGSSCPHERAEIRRLRDRALNAYAWSKRF